MKTVFHAAARGMRSALVAIVSLVATGSIIAIGANYAMTQGSGTTFASAAISAVNYVEFLLCDPTAGATQCAGVNSGGSLQVAGQGTAGTPAGGVVSVQGVGSGTALPVSAASLPLPTGAATSANQSSQITQETATAAALGTTADSVCGTATGTCTLVALQKYNNSALNSAIPAGTNVIGKVGVDQTTFGTTNGVVSAANTYNTVAASQTAQALTGGGGGATGDYLSHCVVTPGTTSPGVVTILDNSTSIVAFPGGASSVSNLVSFTIPLGAKSTSGAWKITTGANVTVVCVGKFT